jgi:hypothetical protein
MRTRTRHSRRDDPRRRHCECTARVHARRVRFDTTSASSSRVLNRSRDSSLEGARARAHRPAASTPTQQSLVGFGGAFRRNRRSASYNARSSAPTRFGVRGERSALSTPRTRGPTHERVAARRVDRRVGTPAIGAGARNVDCVDNARPMPDLDASHDVQRARGEHRAPSRYRQVKKFRRDAFLAAPRRVRATFRRHEHSRTGSRYRCDASAQRLRRFSLATITAPRHHRKSRKVSRCVAGARAQGPGSPAWQPRADSNRRFRLERAASWAARRRGQGPDQKVRQLGGEDSNLQQQGQNLPCCRLHHPRMGSSRVRRTGCGSRASIATQ